MSIQVQIDSYLDKVDSKYALVQVAAKRARQINDYYHNLGEGMHSFEDFTPPLIESRTKNYLSLALEEIAASKIRYEYAD